MGYNTQVWEVLQRSKYIDVDELSKLNPIDIGKAPVNPEQFEFSGEEVIILTNLINDVSCDASNQHQ